jgi:hypothetical protein
MAAVDAALGIPDSLAALRFQGDKVSNSTRVDKL